MIRKTLILFAVTATFGCARVQEMQQKRANNNGYVRPFYARYLNPANPTDRLIMARMESLQANPAQASVHNDLGTLLLDRGFPKDAEVEFHRAISADSRFYPAWYNLGLIHAAQGNHFRAIHDLNKSLSIKPGNAAAHFQLGLLYEKRGATDDAVEHYARAFQINHSLLDVRKNPRIIDSRLVDLALIHMYPDEHARRSIQPQVSSGGSTSSSTSAKPADQGVSPQAAPENIVTPTPAVTEPAVQTPPPTRPSAQPTMGMPPGGGPGSAPPPPKK
ncbi:MAG TPA: tetratricopeptide repeat protein [Thermoanaerobaculia bacterium]|nr:tetratricopeptide repeat protein [Thermoanaerobaculia bacterium]